MKNKKKIFWIILIAILVVFAAGKILFKAPKATFTVEAVKLGTIIQEVSESGTVKTGEAINLSFSSGGKIEKIYVKVGDKVKAGSILAKL
jgi:HlyD family secretion protein